MADLKSPQKRSLNMAKIRSHDTKPEEYLRKILFGCGYRYRKNVNYIPGHPDAWLAKYNTALFMHGCFWHRHKECKYAYMPKSRVEFWEDKFKKNTEHDAQVVAELMKRQIRVLIVYECTVKKMMKNEECRFSTLGKITAFLSSDTMFCEL